MSQAIVISFTVVGASIALAVVAGAYLALRDPESTKRRVEALFRRPPRPPRPPGQNHYYRPYWS